MPARAPVACGKLPALPQAPAVASLSMRAIEQWIYQIADQWWVHPVVGLLSFIDGFFPTVPSESVLVSLGSLWSTTGRPSFVLLVLAGWVGACAGDHMAYWIGAKIGWSRFRFFREGRGRRAIDAAERGLSTHALVFFMTARFIPLGRTTVNLAAGAIGYPLRSFTVRIIPATFLWALYSTGIGALAGQWFASHPLIGIVVALVVALIVSLGLERVVRAVQAYYVARMDRALNQREKTPS